MIPQIFATSDCGNTWTAVTSARDSATDGLDASSALGRGAHMTTSGIAGEVAAFVNNQVYYSRDYGLTWNRVQGTFAAGGGEEAMNVTLYWAHTIDGTERDVVVARVGTTMMVADLTAATPTLTSVTGYVANANDRIGVANGYQQIYIAVGSIATGTPRVRIYPLTATNAGASVADFLMFQVGSSSANELSGLALGGAASVTNPLPSAVLVSVDVGSGGAAAGNFAFQAALKGTDNAWPTNGSTTPVVSGGILRGPSAAGPNCGSASGEGASRIALPMAIAPLTTSAGGLVVAGSCLGMIDGSGVMTASATDGKNAAIDPGWNGTAGATDVLIAPDGNRGLDRVNLTSVTVAPTWPAPTAADANRSSTTSSGKVTHGLTVPVTTDVAFGPAGATDVVTTFSMSGGAQCIASTDGFATQANTKQVTMKGGLSVGWFLGSVGNSWLACGHGDSSLTISNNWTTSTGLVTPAQNSSGSGSYTALTDSIATVEGVLGQDVLWYGGGLAAAGGRAVRTTLSVSSGNTRITNAATLTMPGTEAVNDIEYCPAAGSASGFGDVLFVATSGGVSATGYVYRIASAGSSATQTVASSARMTGSGSSGAKTIKVDCAAGVLYAGFSRPASGTTYVQKSTDGTSLATLGFSLGGAPDVYAMAINPANSSEMVFSSGGDGDMYATSDGGSTFVQVNAGRSATGRNFNSEGVKALAIPPTAAQSRSSIVVPGRAVRGASVTTSRTVVGSGAGAYTASGLRGVAGGGGSGGSGSGGAGAGGSGAGAGPTAAPVAAVRATLAIAGAKWDAKKKGIVATVTASAAGRVTLTVNLKQGAKLKKVASGAAVVKAGANALVLFKMKKPPKGSYALVATHANGATAAGAIRVK